ncbi:hypothetical protein COOONC_16641 [Cooperia oncophora]
MVQCFDIENRVIDKPLVHCGADNIVVEITTEKPFRGRLYVQNEAENNQCLQNGKAETSNHAHFDLPIGACNMRRQRTFFVTGMDRAFHVRCFFLESVKSLGTEFDVGKLKTELVEQEYQLPDCMYQLHDGPSGPAVHFAQVGQRVTHRWSCEDGKISADTYCLQSRKSTFHICKIMKALGARSLQASRILAAP